MPKIPEFQRKSLESSLVGTPGVDTSSAQVLDSIGKVGDSGMQVFGEAAIRRKQAQDTALANKTLVDLDLSLEEAQVNHAKQFAMFRGDPNERTKAFRDQADTMLQNTLDQIDSKDVRLAVSRLGQNVIRERVLKESKLATDQQAVIAFGDVMDSANSLAGAARNAGIAGDAARFNELLHKSSGVRVAAAGVLSPEQRARLDQDVPKSIAAGFISGLNESDPSAVLALANNEQFKSIFTGEELQRYVSNAHEIIEQKSKKADENLKKAQDVARFSFADRIVKGDVVELGEISDAVDKRVLTPDDGEDLLKMVRNAPPIDSNPYIVSDLNTRLMNGTLTAKDVTTNANFISKEERRKYLGYLTSEATDNPAVKRAFDLMNAEVTVQAFGVRLPEDQQRLNFGKDELLERFTNGETDVFKLTDEIIGKMRRQKRNELVLFGKHNLKIVSPENVTVDQIDKEVERITKQFSANQISEQDANDQINFLEELKKTK